MKSEFLIISSSDQAELALKSNPEGFGSAPQVELSLKQKPYEVYSNELDISDKSFEFGAKQGNHDLKFNGKANISNGEIFARLQGSTNNNPKLLDIKGVLRSPREMDFKVKFMQSKFVDISFKDDYEQSKYHGFFEIKGNGESKVHMKFERDDKERQLKFTMTSKLPNLEKVEMSHNDKVE